MGNDEHPGVKGKTSPHAMADVLRLYDPDRIRAPRHEGGPSAGRRPSISSTSALAATKTTGKSVLLVSGAVVSPSRKALLAELKTALPALEHLAVEPASGDAAEEAAKASYGKCCRHPAQAGQGRGHPLPRSRFPERRGSGSSRCLGRQAPPQERPGGHQPPVGAGGTPDPHRHERRSARPRGALAPGRHGLRPSEGNGRQGNHAAFGHRPIRHLRRCSPGRRYPYEDLVEPGEGPPEGRPKRRRALRCPDACRGPSSCPPPECHARSRKPSRTARGTAGDREGLEAASRGMAEGRYAAVVSGT